MPEKRICFLPGVQQYSRGTGEMKGAGTSCEESSSKEDFVHPTNKEEFKNAAKSLKSYLFSKYLRNRFVR